jgi:molybdopterin/thiamine biosynthesis adenylyltransferase
MAERYDRHNLIEWFSQETIARTKAIVIGAGAVGNEVVKNLALLGVGEIEIFDLDIIEEHNLTRSVLFRNVHVGRSKAEVAAEQAAVLDENVTVRGTHGDFWDRLRFSNLRSADILFCCVDNFEARIRCNTLCSLARVDFVNIGIDSRFAVVELFPFSGGRSIACYECGLPDSVYRRISERYSCGKLRKLSFVEKKIPTTIVTSSIAASFAVSMGLRLGGDADEANAHRIYVDTISGNLTRTSLERVGGCPGCGRYDGASEIFTSGREIGRWNIEWQIDATVIASEPILVGYRIGDCETLVFQNASSFDSAFPERVARDGGTVELDIRDQFSLEELSTRFFDRIMPCKFALVLTEERTIAFEFVGEERNE